MTKALPHDVAAEESLLGSIMLSERAIAVASETVHVEDFHTTKNGVIFDALLGLYGRGEPVDVVTAVDELKRRGVLEDVGGHLYVAELIERVPTPAAAATYARIVAESAVRRALVHAGYEIAERALDEQPVDELAELAEDLVFRAVRRRAMDHAAAAEDVVYEAIGELGAPERDGVPTGFIDVDDYLGGLRPSSLYVIAARPGVGKSAFVTNIARNFALADPPRAVAMWSLEMSRLEIGIRLIAAEARIPWESMRGREPTDRESNALAHAADAFSGSVFWILDSPTSTIVDIRARARRFQTTRGLDLVIVDYLQLMSSVEKSRAKNREQEVAEISRGLKVLAKELEIPVIAVSQLNRDPERRAGKRPQLSDLRESGSLEQDSDVVIFIHRDEDSPGVAEVIVAKHRNGRTGSTRLTFLADVTRFADYMDEGRP